MTGRAVVLVVDDEPGIRDMLSFELSQEGFDVETAENGLAAVEAVKRRKFDLVITDLKMPGMDGVATVEALRALDPDIEVIVATGYASVETAVACMRHGAYDYIQKPYDLVELKFLLERALQTSHLQGVVALYEASRALLATLSPSDLVRMVLTVAQQVLRADATALVLGSETRSLVARSDGEQPPEELLAELAGRATVERSPLRLPTLGEGLTSTAGRHGYSSALAYPLSGRDGTLGVLVVLRRSISPAFAPTELQRGTIFANQLALSLDNARLYDDLGQRIAELVSTREQLVHAEKLVLAGELAGSVAHEVNNPLSIVRSNLNALRDYSSTVGALWLAAKEAALHLRGQSSPTSHEHAQRLCQAGADPLAEETVRGIAEVIDETLEGVKRIAELVAGFRALSNRQQPARPEAVDVSEVVRQCVALLSGGTASLTLALTEPGRCVALTDPDDLRTALLNLISFLSTARREDTGPDTGVTIRTQAIDGRPFVNLSAEGVRLSAEEQRRLFDPRVDVDICRGRTMRLNLDLALAYQMLRRNGVEVSVRDAGDRGVEFEVRLPAAPGQGAVP